MTAPSLALLRAELEAALVEAGFALHDCVARSPLGGVCLTPSTISAYEPGAALIVTWAVSERLQEGPHYDRYQSVLATMNAALADVVEALGFVSEGALSSSTVAIVRKRASWQASRSRPGSTPATTRSPSRSHRTSSAAT